MEKETEKLLDAEELAQWLGLNVQTVYRMAQRGEIPSIRVARKILRFKRGDIETWLNEKAEGGQGR